MSEGMRTSSSSRGMSIVTKKPLLEPLALDLQIALDQLTLTAERGELPF